MALAPFGALQVCTSYISACIYSSDSKNYLQQWHRKTSISIPSTSHRNAARYSHPHARSSACPKEQIKFLHGYKDKDLHKFTKASWHLGTTVHKQYQLAHSTAPGRCPTFEHSGNHYAVLRKKKMVQEDSASSHQHSYHYKH